MDQSSTRSASNITRLIIAVFVIFVSEALIMGVIQFVPAPHPLLVLFLDSILVSLVAVPALYFLLYKPMIAENLKWLATKTQLNRSTLYDQLTNLPNSTLFEERVQYEILNSDRLERPFALIMIRIHDLTEINRSLGHKYGDGVLQYIANRFQKGLRKSDTISRFSGNIFCILMPGVKENLAYIVSRKLQLMLDENITLENIQISIELSGGIVVYPRHGNDQHSLIRLADVASRRKSDEQNNFTVYNLDNDEYSKRQLTIYTALKDAVDNKSQLQLHYQPKVLLATGATQSVEALARWQDSRLGIVSPGEFIPLAERTALIRPLTWKIIQIALDDIVKWKNSGFTINVAVNLSTRNLNDPALLEKLLEMLGERGLSTTQIELEITESAIMEDTQRSMLSLLKLKEAGFTLSIDDFGTGYSSLSYLCDLPVDYLKIDQSFIKDIISRASSELVVKSIIDLSHNVGLKVIAEGVEDETIYNKLKQLQCDFAQGYHISKPLAAADLQHFLDND